MEDYVPRKGSRFWMRAYTEREDALAAAPDQDDEFFRTPPVIE